MTFRKTTYLLNETILRAAVFKRPNSPSDLLVLIIGTGSVLFIDLITWKVIDEQFAEYDPYLGAAASDLKIACDPAGRAIALSSIHTGPQICIPIKSSTDGQITQFSELPPLDLDVSSIISSCFLPALTDGHSNHQILIVLFSSRNSESGSTSIKAAMFENAHNGSRESFVQTSCTPLSLNTPSSDILFMIPLSSAVGVFLVVTSENVCLFTLNDIVSATFKYESVYLPEVPISFFQDNIYFTSNTGDQQYPEQQDIYFGAESNKIYKLTVSLQQRNKWSLSVSLFEEVPVAIGSSLIIFACDQDSKIDFNGPISKASEFVVYTGGVPASFSHVTCTKGNGKTIFDKEPQYSWDYPIDAICLDTQSSFPNKSYSQKRQELYLLGGLSANTWKLTHIRSGIKLNNASESSQLPKDSKIFPLSITPVSADSQTSTLPQKPLHFFLSTSDFGSMFYSFDNNHNHDETNWIIDLENKTLAMGSYNGMIIQVTTEGLSISNPMDPKVHMFIQMNPIHVHIHQNYIITATVSSDSPNEEFEITVYDLDFSKYPSEDILQIIPVCKIPREDLTSITLVRLIQSNTDISKPLAFVGIGTTKSSVLKIFNLDSIEPLEAYNLNIKDTLNEKSFVNDVIKIPTLTSENEVLVGLRNGTFHSIKWKVIPSSGLLNMWLKSSYTVGSEEVNFVPSAEEGANRVYIFSDLMYKAGPPDYIPQLAIPDINNLDSPSSVCSFYDQNEGETLVSVYDNKLQYFKIDQTPGIFGRSFPLQSSPRQALYLDYLDLIVVLCASPFDNSYSSTAPFLQIFDPTSGAKVLKTSFKPRVNEMKRKLEKFNFMNEWVINVKQSDTKPPEETTTESNTNNAEVQYRFLVLCSEYGNEGRVHLFRLTKSKASKSYKLVESAVQYIDEPALSTCQLDNNRILIRTTSKVITLRLDISNNRCRMIICDPTISVVSRHMHFQNNNLFLTTESESVAVYELEDNKFTKIQSEDCIRACISQTLVDDKTVIVSDLNRMVTILGSYSSENVNTDSNGDMQINKQLATSSLHKIAEFQLPTLVRRIVPIKLLDNSALKMLATQDKKTIEDNLDSLSLGFEQLSSSANTKESDISSDYIVLGIDGSIFVLHLLDYSTFTAVQNKILDLNLDEDFEDFDFDAFGSQPENENHPVLNSCSVKEKLKSLNVIDGDHLLSNYSYVSWVKMLVNLLNTYY